MVSSTVIDKTENTSSQKPNAVGIPSGKYRLVGWDMDATGKKLIDEICQIACYTPSSSYFQYVMPYKNLNPPAIKRHNMKVVTIGKYRVLKNNKTNKMLKTKSEISALMDFLTWIESIKGDATDGIILVYHEPRKVIPAMLLESLKKYNLLERFKKTVIGFVNGFAVAEARCPSSDRAFSLRALSRTLLNQEKPLDNARNRADLALQIVQHISSQPVKKEEVANEIKKEEVNMERTIDFIREFVQPVEHEEKEYAELKVVFERQNTLRPIFGALFRMTRRERQHASPLRRLLAEAGIEYLQLEEAWVDGKKEGLEKLIKEKLTTAEEKKIEDLLVVLEEHFDPEKKPKTKAPQIKKEMKSDKIENSKSKAKIYADKKNNNKCDSGSESPDTTTVSLSGENGVVSTDESAP